MAADKTTSPPGQKVKGKIRFLKDIDRSIRRSALGIMFLVVIATVSFHWFIMLYVSESQKQSRYRETITLMEIYKSELAGQLGIIASTTLFMDYIRSGPLTRSELHNEFLYALSHFDRSEIKGYTLTNLDRKTIFEWGTKTPTRLALELRYLNESLNPRLGDYAGTLTFFIDKKPFFTQLQKINPSLLPCPECSPVFLAAGTNLGFFTIAPETNLSFQFKLPSPSMAPLFVFEITLFLAILVYGIWIRRRTSYLVRNYLERPLSYITLHLTKKLPLKTRDDHLREVNYLISHINTWQEQSKNMERTEREAELGKQARQVAHDIRSPLTALEVAVDTPFSEESRTLLKSAVTRIRDIANDLVGRRGHFNTESDKLSTQCIADVAETLVSEKRLQYRTRDLNIETHFNISSYYVFAKIETIQFKRVISNIINNSAEAIQGPGSITLSLDSDITHLKLRVKDTGKGIAPELLDKVFERGATFDKQEGTGLGLSHAKKMVEKWGGELSIQSVVNQGSTVVLTLPRAKTPDWFVPRLTLCENSQVVILDDDRSVHETWKERFSHDDLKGHNISVIHFFSEREILAHEKKETALYLIDYELPGDFDNGIEIIEKLGTQNAILVTSHYNEPDVLKACHKAGIRVLPKTLIRHIPIEIGSSVLFSRSDNHPTLPTS